MKIIAPYRLVRLFVLVLSALLLAACGGGGGGSDDSIKAAPSVNTLTVTPHSIQVSRDGTSQVPATLNLTLTTPSGAPASGVVTFAVPANVTVGKKNAPVRINASGVALVRVAANFSGAGKIKTAYTSGGGASSGPSIKFTSTVTDSSGDGSDTPAPDAPKLSAITLTDGGSPVGTNDHPITAASNAKAKVSLFEADGTTAMTGKVVTFTLLNGVGQLDPAIGTALTDGNGEAVIDLKAGDTKGAGALVASYLAGDNTIKSQPLGFTTEGGGVVTTQKLALGKGQGKSFVAEKMDEPAGSVAAGSTYSVTVNVVDSNSGGLYTAPVKVSFSSLCASLATLSPAVRTSVGGMATTSYSPKNGCNKDTITATAKVNGKTLKATTPEFNIKQSPVNTISFVSASPEKIGLKGASAVGVEESSILTFEIKNQNGTTVGAGVDVKFSVQTPVGGFDISGSTNATTRADGQVSVTVKSGSVPMVGTIKAALKSDPSIYGTGSVSVQSGVPTEDHFTLSVKTSNPAAWNHPGTPVQVEVRAADRYGNWVPNGTTINFSTKLGKVDPSCTTESGFCEVTWKSQGPQPNNFDPNRVGAGCASFDATNWYRHGLPTQPWQMACGKHDRYGINVITAWATGEESFSDTDGNNVYGDGEPFVDLGESFGDNNLNGKYDATAGSFSEDFQDLDVNGEYTGPSSSYNGLSCDMSTNSTCQNSLINVRRAVTMVLSTDEIQMGVWPAGDPELANLDVTAPTAFNKDVQFTPASAVAAELTDTISVDSITVVVADMNGNTPPIGTKIEVKAKADDAALVKADVAGPKECTLGSTLKLMTCTFNLIGTTAGEDAGNKFIITATSGTDDPKPTATRVLTVP